jgi:hypothetical protein
MFQGHAAVNENELKLLLAKAAIIDKRNVDVATLKHWAEILGDISYLEANAALIETRRTMAPGEYLVPSHITRKVYGWRNQYANSHPENPGTQALVYVQELRTYLPSAYVESALRDYWAAKGIAYDQQARPQISGQKGE